MTTHTYHRHIAKPDMHNQVQGLPREPTHVDSVECCRFREATQQRDRAGALPRAAARDQQHRLQGNSNATYEEMMTPGVACVMWGDVGDGFSSALLIVASHERQWTFSHQRRRVVEVPMASLQSFNL